MKSWNTKNQFWWFLVKYISQLYLKPYICLTVIPSEKLPVYFMSLLAIVVATKCGQVAVYIVIVKKIFVNILAEHFFAMTHSQVYVASSWYSAVRNKFLWQINYIDFWLGLWRWIILKRLTFAFKYFHSLFINIFNQEDYSTEYCWFQ